MRSQSWFFFLIREPFRLLERDIRRSHFIALFLSQDAMIDDDFWLFTEYDSIVHQH